MNTQQYIYHTGQTASREHVGTCIPPKPRSSLLHNTHILSFNSQQIQISPTTHKPLYPPRPNNKIPNPYRIYNTIHPPLPISPPHLTTPIRTPPPRPQKHRNMKMLPPPPLLHPKPHLNIRIKSLNPPFIKIFANIKRQPPFLVARGILHDIGDRRWCRDFGIG